MTPKELKQKIAETMANSKKPNKTSEINKLVDNFINDTFGSCGECEFWEQHKPQGTCSQKRQVSDLSNMVNIITFTDEYCECYKKKK